MTCHATRATSSSTIYFLLTMLGIWIGFGPVANAIEPARTRFEFERADIPANLPAAWPKEVDRLTPVPRDEFESLIGQLNSRNLGPRPAWLKSAHFEATLINDSLNHGMLTASVQRLATQSSLLELGQFSLALEDLRWQNRPATWGTSKDGRVWLVADGVNEELLGEWSCRGRTFPGGIDFDLHLPLATTSFLDLRVPKKYKVSSNVGEVLVLSDVPTEDSRLWRIQCGSESHCRLTFLASEGLAASRRAIFVEQDMQVTLREEELRFKLNLFLEALDEPIQDLILKVPAGIEIHSAVYGADTTIPIQRSAEAKADGRIPIRLPGLLSGRRRTLHIDGSADQKPGQPVVIPNIAVEDSTFDGGHLAVSVQAPLEVRSIRSHGFRQRTADGGQRTTDIESFTFQQMTADSQLILDVHRAPISLSGQSMTVLEVQEDSWNITSEIVWTSLTGRAYQTSCQLPTNWEVIDVVLSSEQESRQSGKSLDDASRLRETSKLNWEVQTQSAGTSMLTIEFLDPIQLGQSRTVKVVARRRPPQPGQSVPIPLPQLMNCEIAEMILGVQVPTSLNPIVSTESQLERIVRPTSTVFTIPAEKPNMELRWFREDSVDITGTIELRPRLLPINAKSKTVVEALPAEYRLKYSIEYEQRELQADRLLAYLTESSPDIRWSLKGTPSIELSAAKLPKTSHVEWNLPSKGELWEIRLPRPTGQTATIEGLTTNRWSTNNRLALLFVPQAVEKTAELRLTQPEALELSFDTNGLKPTGQRQSWLYATPQAEFSLSLRNPEPSREFPLMVSMQLRTLMSADNEGFDVYRARLQLENGSAQESLRIKIEPGTTIQEAFVSGELIALTVHGGEIVIPGLNAARRDVVELNYRVPARSITLRQRRQIVIPQISAQVLGFSWEFSIPPTTQIFAEPTGVRLTRSLPKATWHERLFGPLGRTTTESIFNPFQIDSWIQFILPRHASLNFRNADGELVAIYQSIAPTLPEGLSIELWHASRIQLLIWITFGLCLSTGIIMRMIQWNYRDRVAAYWLSLTIAASFSATPPYLGILGGAIAGTLIALLIPHHLLRRSVRTRDLADAEQPHMPVAVIVSLLIAISFAGLPALCSKLNAQESPSEESSANKKPVIFVPVDDNGLPSETVRLVYVPPDVWARWKAIVGDHSTEPTYLISSARYQVDSTRDDFIGLTARFRVHVLVPMNNPVSVTLGLSDLSLPDAESCRVNGKTYPISVLPNGKGYVLELMQRAAPESVIQPLKYRPEDDETKEKKFEISTFEIELRSRKPRPTVPSLELRIPAVANSQLAFSTSEPTPFVEVVGSHGATEKQDQSRITVSELGLAWSVQLRWGQSAPAPRPAKVTASLLQNLELHAAYSELGFQLSAQVNSGSIDALDFDLPQNAIVRKIQSRADDLLRADVIVTKEGQRRLRLVFVKPLQTTINIDGTLVLLQPESLAQTPLPKFGISPSDAFDFQYSRNWWGVSTSSDFRLNALNLDAETNNAISPEAYLHAWVEPGETRRPESVITRQPQFTFNFHEGITPTFTLTPFQTRRRAIQWNQIGVIGKRRLTWTLVGEIETAQAPIFQTVLLVDRRLRIEKISVKENDAERRNRWTESRTDPSRVVLFLSDKTQGKQTITLQGSMPISPGVPIQLPSIRPEDCETGDSRLILMHDPEIEVDFTPSPDWKPVSTENADLPRGGSSQILGAYQINDLVIRDKFQTSSRHSRCTSRAAVFLNRLEGSSWLMKYRLEMTPEGESPLRMGLKFPASISDINSVVVERAESAWQELSDGYRQLDLLLNRGEGPGSVIVQFEIPLVEPKVPDWELPLPIPMFSNNHETLLAFEPDSIWFPNNGNEVRATNLTDWTSHFFHELSGDRNVFRVADPHVEIHRDVSNTDLRDSMIRLLDQRVWLNQNGSGCGITQAFLSSLRKDLVFEITPQVSITSIFLDDHPLALQTPSDGRFVIPMLEVGAESILTISWETGANRPRFGGSKNEFLLWPTDIKVSRSLISVFPENSTRLWHPSGLKEISLLDQNLDRLDALLERHAGLVDESKASNMNRWLIHQLQSRLAHRLPAEVERPSDAVRERLNRWKQITEAINQLEPVPLTPPLNWHLRLLDGPVTESDAALRGKESRASEIHFWQFNQQLVLYFLSAVLALNLIRIFRRLIRLEWSGWLHQHVGISWSLLAIFWWLFLTPSAFGPILLLLGFVRVVMFTKSASTSVSSQSITA